MLPFTIEGSAGRLFALYRPPAAGRAHAGDVLFVPPFAEEMNRSRRMATVLAARLAEQGIGFLVIDLFGTGDSEGEFAGARLSIWRDDLIRAYDWLAARGAPMVGLVALRFGAPLAFELAAARAVSRIVLWQPVASGEQMLTQFLRIRQAAGLTSGAGETTASMRASLVAGATLEVAGYDIAPSLAVELDALRLDPAMVSNGVLLHWFELVAEEGRPIPPGSARMIEALRARIPALDARPIVGDAFWTLLETTVAPALIDATGRAFA